MSSTAIAELSIRSMYCGLPRDKWDRRLLVSLTAYIDDSGSGGDSQYYVLGGYVASVTDWDLFTKDWIAELHNKPEIDYFKSAEAEALDGQFTLVPREI